MIPRSVRLVTLDVGGTLIHPYPSVGAVYAEVLTRRGFPAEPAATELAFEEAWERSARRVPSSQERYRWSPDGERGYWRALLQMTVEGLGGDAVPEGAAEELFERFGHRETWRLYPEVPAILATLASRGIPLGILSNWDSRLPTLLREMGIRHYFGPIIISALEGYEKPDPRIFRLAASRAGVELAAMLHVGDKEREDLAGAREAGCPGLKVDRNGGNGEGLGALLRWFSEAPAGERRGEPS